MAVLSGLLAAARRTDSYCQSAALSAAELPPSHDTALVIRLGPRPPASDTAALTAWLRVLSALGTRQRVSIQSGLQLLRASSAAYAKIGFPSSLQTLAFNQAQAAGAIQRAISSSCAACLALTTSAFIVPQTVIDPQSTRAGGTYAVTRSELAELGPSLDILRRARRVTADDQIGEIEFGERPITDDDRYGDGFAQDFTQIQAALASSAPRRNTILAILDSGWPTPEDKTYSLALLDSLESLARTVFGVVSKDGAVDPGPWSLPNYPHVLSVKAAIDPLVPLDISVHVLYVPLVWPRSDSAALRRLLTTSRIINAQAERLLGFSGPCLGSVDYKHCFNQDSHLYASIVAGDTAGVDAAVRRLTADTVRHQFSESLQSTSELYNALWLLLEAWSEEHNNTAAFLNASWLASFAYEVLPPVQTFTNATVVTVAAAGNDNADLTPNTATANFVVRPYKPDRNFLVVQNTRMSGERMCYSNLLKRVPLANRQMVASEFGLVETAGTCGSSFAAPRVAWILATAETFRPNGCVPLDEPLRRLVAQDATKAEPWHWPSLYIGMATGYAPIQGDPCQDNS